MFDRHRLALVAACSCCECPGAALCCSARQTPRPRRASRRRGASRSCRWGRRCCPTARRARRAALPCAWRSPCVHHGGFAALSCVLLLRARALVALLNPAHAPTRQAMLAHNDATRRVELVVDKTYEARWVCAVVSSPCSITRLLPAPVEAAQGPPAAEHRLDSSLPIPPPQLGDPVYAWCGPQPNSRLLINYVRACVFVGCLLRLASRCPGLRAVCLLPPGCASWSALLTVKRAH